MTKVQKSKIWDDSFLAFSVAFAVVYFVFSVGAVITEIFADQNCHFCKFPKKTKNGRFRAAKFAPWKWFFLLFPPAIFLARPRATFCTPQLWSGTQNEDFQQWSPIDHKWSFCQKNHFFSPIKIWSKWSLKIAPKPSVLRKKLIKATLKYTDWRAFCTYWLCSGCWGSARNLAAKIVKICVFLNFWKN